MKLECSHTWCGRVWSLTFNPLTDDEEVVIEDGPEISAIFINNEGLEECSECGQIVKGVSREYS